MPSGRCNRSEPPASKSLETHTSGRTGKEFPSYAHWDVGKLENHLPPELERQTGIRFRYATSVDPEV